MVEVQFCKLGACVRFIPGAPKMIKVAPMIPREVWDKIETLVKDMLVMAGPDEDNWWCVHSLITREVLSLLEKEGCLKEPPKKVS